MTDKSYSIIFSSPTGNTRLLADTIRDALPEENCNYFGVSENADTQSDILFIGFWTDKGTADKATLDLLETLKNKRIFLFGTAVKHKAVSYDRNRRRRGVLQKNPRKYKKEH